MNKSQKCMDCCFVESCPANRKCGYYFSIYSDSGCDDDNAGYGVEEFGDYYEAWLAYISDF